MNEERTKRQLDKLKYELKAVGLAALFFTCFLAFLLTIKQFLLEEYQIQFSGMSMAVVDALVLSKVVLVLERVCS